MTHNVYTADEAKQFQTGAEYTPIIFRRHRIVVNVTMSREHPQYEGPHDSFSIHVNDLVDGLAEVHTIEVRRAVPQSMTRTWGPLDVCGQVHEPVAI
jgi:hypothetical protein